jgi:hypothetical protein
MIDVPEQNTITAQGVGSYTLLKYITLRFMRVKFRDIIILRYCVYKYTRRFRFSMGGVESVILRKVL